MKSGHFVDRPGHIAGGSGAGHACRVVRRPARLEHEDEHVAHSDAHRDLPQAASSGARTGLPAWFWCRVVEATGVSGHRAASMRHHELPSATVMVSPLTPLACSLTRKVITEATSSALTILPAG